MALALLRELNCLIATEIGIRVQSDCTYLRELQMRIPLPIVD